jgi:RNA polymerase II subunit A C-terminal domain phosphatase SSU72
MRVESYGTGTQVRLPGKSAMEPRIFKFGTPYAEMYRSLSATPEDEAFFVHNGVLQLCKRGASVKVSYRVLLLERSPCLLVMFSYYFLFYCLF